MNSTVTEWQIGTKNWALFGKLIGTKCLCALQWFSIHYQFNANEWPCAGPGGRLMAILEQVLKSSSLNYRQIKPSLRATPDSKPICTWGLDVHDNPFLLSTPSRSARSRRRARTSPCQPPRRSCRTTCAGSATGSASTGSAWRATRTPRASGGGRGTRTNRRACESAEYTPPSTPDNRTTRALRCFLQWSCLLCVRKNC